MPRQSDRNLPAFLTMIRIKMYQNADSFKQNTTTATMRSASFLRKTVLFPHLTDVSKHVEDHILLLLPTFVFLHI